MRVLVTRPQKSAERFARRLEMSGHQALISPVIQIAPMRAEIPGGPFSAIIATSAHAFEFLHADQSRFEQLSALPLYLVGQITAMQARAMNFPDIAHVAQHAAALADAIISDLPTGHFLYLAGANRKPGLEEKLAAASRQVIIAVTYRAVPADGLSSAAISDISTGKIDAIVHFSRRSAGIFVDLAKAAGLTHHVQDMRHICLSDDVAKGLAALTQANVLTASTPSSETLIEILNRTNV